MTSSTKYLEPTQNAGRLFVQRGVEGSIVMLNLMRFREIADYTAHPELAPALPISGAEAFDRYVQHTLPFLRESGGELLFLGAGGPFLIGPEDETWDMAMLVRQSSVASFLAFASHEAYLAGIGHRTAAVEDSRLLPLAELQPPACYGRAATMKAVQANGVELAYDSFGDEANDTILLIAGLGTQMIRWTAPFCEKLAACGYRVIRFDNRDAGCSTHFSQCAPPDFAALAATLMAGRRPDVPYTLYDMAADTISLLDVLSIDRAHVVGRSMGGMVAQIMASEHPERVLSLTSMMSSTGNPELPQAAPDVMAMMTRPAPDPFSDEPGFLAQTIAFAQRISGSRFPVDAEAHGILVLDEIRRAYDPSGAARQIAAMAVAGDRRSRLATIMAPTLVVHGTDDPLILPVCGKDTATSIPNAELMLIDGMGHDLPPALYQTIVEAIDRTARRASR